MRRPRREWTFDPENEEIRRLQKSMMPCLADGKTMLQFISFAVTGASHPSAVHTTASQVVLAMAEAMLELVAEVAPLCAQVVQEQIESVRELQKKGGKDNG